MTRPSIATMPARTMLAYVTHPVGLFTILEPHHSITKKRDEREKRETRDEQDKGRVRVQNFWELDTMNFTLRLGHDAIFLPILLVAPFPLVTRITLQTSRVPIF
ncbi:MAG: hypothetical protein HXY51_15975 [Nitrospirae bacterium]|nr:hypothetical protein [Nitrospirota bacterium]